jgi:DNA repair protein RadC
MNFNTRHKTSHNHSGNRFGKFGVVCISYIKKNRCKMADRPLYSGSKDAYKILMHHWNADKIYLVEEFKVLFLNRKNRVCQLYTLSQGGITSVSVDPRIIFAAAIKLKARGLIMAHNHPSGGLEPSEEDKELTDQLKKGAKLLNISLIDHLIVTPGGYFSFSDRGLL